MALQFSKVTEHGFTAPAAYAKIVGYHFDDGRPLRFDIKVFYDVQSRTDDKQPIDYIFCDMDAPVSDMLPALYTHLKTLPEFVDAIDV